MEKLLIPSQMTLVLGAIFIAVTLVRLYQGWAVDQRRTLPSVGCTWMFLLSFLVADIVSFPLGVWIMALLSFWALREYLSLVDVRRQDRLGILGAYLSIPFMYYFIQTGWYGMFIVSIPVYAFLAVPLLVTLGGSETRGTVFSIGVIDFGLFLFVFCIGHVGYLLSYSVWMATLLILGVALSDLVSELAGRRAEPGLSRLLRRLLAPMPVVVTLAWLLSDWAGIPTGHAITIGMIIPPLVLMGHHTGDYIKDDLGIEVDSLGPGRGRILDSAKSFLFAAPVVFHYIHYFLR